MFANKFVRRVGSTVFQGKRMMSGQSSEEAMKEVATWQKLTAGMIGLSSLLAVYCVVAHSHEHVRKGLPYQHIRTKPYPWSCSDCNLFDNECWKECRANA